MTGHSEQTPLLDYLPQWQRHHKRRSFWQAWRIPILCYTGALLFDSAQTIRSTPKTKLFETIICQRYYSFIDHPNVDFGISESVSAIPEHMCKVNPIQTELVAVKAWLKIGENLSALLLAIPFGRLANTRGRSLVLILGILGQILAETWILVICYFNSIFPFPVVYVSVLLRSLGGGEMVLSAIVHVILADVVAQEDRARAFFHLASTTLLSEVLAPVVGSILMDTYGVYMPLLWGFPLQIAAIVVFGLIPDMRRGIKQAGKGGDNDDVGGNHEDGAEESGETGGWVAVVIRAFLNAWTVFCRSGRILLVNISFLTTMLARETLDYLVQYVSKRFEWSLAKANYLVSLKALTNLVLFLLILPIVSRALGRYYSMTPPRVDLWIARGCSLFGIIGPVLLGLSTSPAPMILSLILFTLSSGYPHAIQSYGTSLICPADVASFYSLLAVIRIGGTLVSSPLLAATFNAGLTVGGSGLGIIFHVAGGLFGIGAVSAWLLR